MARWKAVFECEGCEHYRMAYHDKEKFCHYAMDTGRCRVIDGKVVPAEKCFKKKVFFEGK